MRIRSMVVSLARSDSALLAVAGVAAVAVTLIPNALGLVFDIYLLHYWGVLSLFVGVSWLVPGVLLGVAIWLRKERAGRRAFKRAVSITAGIVAAVGLLAASVILLALGTPESLVETESEPTQVNTAPAPPPPSPQTDVERRVALVTAAAERAHDVRVVAVICGKTTKAQEIALSTCAVTFAGPTCQLWIVTTTGAEDKPIPLGDPADGMRGSYDETRGMSCRK